MPVTLSPDVEAKVKTLKRINMDYYKPYDDDDSVYQHLINGPDPESIKRNLK